MQLALRGPTANIFVGNMGKREILPLKGKFIDNSQFPSVNEGVWNVTGRGMSLFVFRFVSNLLPILGVDVLSRLLWNQPILICFRFLVVVFWAGYCEIGIPPLSRSWPHQEGGVELRRLILTKRLNHSLTTDEIEIESFNTKLKSHSSPARMDCNLWN